MICPRCGVSCESDQTICRQCDAPLPTSTSAEPSVSSVNEPPAASIISITEQTVPGGAQPYQWDAVWVTTEPAPTPLPDQTPTGIAVTKRAERPNALNVVAILAVLSGFLAIIGSFLAQLSISSDAPIADVLGNYRLNDLTAAFRLGGLFTGSNLQVGVLVVGAIMVLAALFAMWGKPYGAGLASGAALALAPVVICIWGNIDKIADTAVLQALDAKQATRQGTFIDTGAGLGFFFLAGSAVLGLITLIVALASRKSDERAPFNRVLVAVAAVASLVAAAGQLVPQDGASFTDNFSRDPVGPGLLIGRLSIIALVALCGVVGFIRRDRWGLALAAGGVSIYFWQWLSSVGGLGDFPAAPAFGRPGSLDLKPHITTSIGLITMVILGASTLALTGQDRERPQ